MINKPLYTKIRVSYPIYNYEVARSLRWKSTHILVPQGDEKFFRDILQGWMTPEEDILIDEDDELGFDGESG